MPTPKAKEIPVQDKVALRPDEAAGLASVSTDMIYRWCRIEDPAMRLPHVKDGRFLLIPRSMLLEWLEARAVADHLSLSSDPIVMREPQTRGRPRRHNPYPLDIS